MQNVCFAISLLLITLKFDLCCLLQNYFEDSSCCIASQHTDVCALLSTRVHMFDNGYTVCGLPILKKIRERRFGALELA